MLDNGTRRPSSSRLAYFWFIMAAGNLLWTAIPHLMMMLKTDIPNQANPINTTYFPPVSRLGEALMLSKGGNRRCTTNNDYIQLFGGHIYKNKLWYYSFNLISILFPVHKPFPEDRLVHLKEQVRSMFYWGYQNYMKHAFPADELDPIHCTGRGHDWTNP